MLSSSANACDPELYASLNHVLSKIPKSRSISESVEINESLSEATLKEVAKWQEGYDAYMKPEAIALRKNSTIFDVNDPTHWPLMEANDPGKVTEVILTKGGAKQSIGPFVKSGAYGQVYCYDPSCTWVIKMPRKMIDADVLVNEMEGYLHCKKMGIPIIEHRIFPDAPLMLYHLKPFASGKSLKELAAPPNKLTPEQLESLINIYSRILKGNKMIDIAPSNLVWNEEKNRLSFWKR